MKQHRLFSPASSMLWCGKCFEEMALQSNPVCWVVSLLISNRNTPPCEERRVCFFLCLHYHFPLSSPTFHPSRKRHLFKADTVLHLLAWYHGTPTVNFAFSGFKISPKDSCILWRQGRMQEKYIFFNALMQKHTHAHAHTYKYLFHPLPTYYKGKRVKIPGNLSFKIGCTG